MRIGRVTFDAHTLLFASVAILCGYQSILFAIFSKTFAITEGLMPDDPRLDRFFAAVNLERGLLAGFGVARRRCRAAPRCDQSVAPAQFRRAGLRRDDAMGRAGRDADRARVPDDSVQFLREHSRHAAPMSGQAPGTDFDDYAADYDAALARGVAVSGESKDYFAQGRVSLARGMPGSPVVHAPRGARLRVRHGIGRAVSRRAAWNRVDPGRRRVGTVDRAGAAAAGVDDPARFALATEYRPDASFDLAFCNGVFHHIPPADRGGAVDYVKRALRPGGLFAFWENNPWNPGARYVMSRIPFDRDAIMISSLEAQRLLRSAGFEIVRTDFQFLFPRALKALRGLEPAAARLPLGAQYQVLVRKPAAPRVLTVLRGRAAT